MEAKLPGASVYDARVTSGYRHPEYAASLSEFGDPIWLPRTAGFLLRRRIAGELRDAMGPYPLFCCGDWSALAADLEELDGELVSVGLVADPFGNWTVDQLDHAFPDRRVAFKEHFVVELAPDPLSRVSSHHQRFVARGQRRVEVELVRTPLSLLDDWVGLYAELVRRHRITGVAAFSSGSFRQQLTVPGLVAFRAVEADEVVGAVLWYCDREVAYWHLAAYSPRGYKLDASYALLGAALEHFADAGMRWACLGAGAGAGAGREASDGLSRFKAGWASGTRTAHFCGRILDPDRYKALSTIESPFFPAYRAGSMARQ
jgi:Acetyltransferase (GNAT) domain